MARLYAVRHVIQAASQFDRQVPTTTPVDDSGLRIYPADTQGGEFDFNALAELTGDDKIPWFVHEILLDLDGNTTAWDISVTDGSDNIEVVAGTNETNYYWNDATPIIVLPDQTLTISTTNATGQLAAWVIYAPGDIGGY